VCVGSSNHGTADSDKLTYNSVNTIDVEYSVCGMSCVRKSLGPMQMLGAVE